MKKDIDTLERIYGELTDKCDAVRSRLNALGLKSAYGFYNNHYHMASDGAYRPDSFPIPVISVDGTCDIELDVRAVGISAKLTRSDALVYDFMSLPRKFELYGVENFLGDFYAEGDFGSDIHEKISRSDETEIGIAFSFENDESAETIAGFILYIKSRGFYY